MAPSNKLAVTVSVLLALAALSMVEAQVPPPPPPTPSPPGVPSTPPPAVPPAPSTGNGSSCNPLKLRVCANLLGGLLGVLLPGAGSGTNSQQCCPLLRGLVDLDAAVCLCTAIRANVFGIISFNVPLGLRLGKAVPGGFTCAPA